MRRLIGKVKAIYGELGRKGKRGVKAIKAVANRFTEIKAHYRFFAKTREKKNEILWEAVALSQRALHGISGLVPQTPRFESLRQAHQQEILKLLDLGPRLLEQILYWVDTGKVAKDKILSLWKLSPTAIGKGKIGKPVEFGRKWVLNAYQGGYVLLTAPDNPKISDHNCVWESLSLHRECFDKTPSSYATDRGMWGQPNLELCPNAAIKQIGIQPKGKARALVGRRVLRQLRNRRAGIEARIAHLKTCGLGKSRMKSDAGDLILGYRSALSYNLTLLMRDLKLQPTLVGAISQ